MYVPGENVDLNSFFKTVKGGMARQQSDICPHWSAEDRSCLLSRSGLYLPVQEHVDIYCQGENFLSCSQFIAHADVGGSACADSGANHRRYPRVPGRFSFKVAKREQDYVGRVIDDAATTVDLSPGGIRFESYRALPEGIEIIFSLNGDFSDVPLRGCGLVKWCNSLENAPLYHAGIAFADPEVARTIGERFGLAAD